MKITYQSLLTSIAIIDHLFLSKLVESRVTTRYKILNADNDVTVMDNYSNAITQSNVTCDGVACMITNACVSKNSGVILFGNEDHVLKEKEKLRYILKQSYSCPYCEKRVLVERAQSQAGRRYIHDSTATLATGLDNQNCGHQLGDVIWPMIRLNLKFRDPEEVIKNGLGTLFVQSSKFLCHNLYKPIAHVYSTYDVIPESGICFRNILVGTAGENYSSSSRRVIGKSFSRDMRAMRSLYYKFYDTHENPKMDCVVITIKRGNGGGTHLYNIHNINEIVEMIHTSFPAYEVLVLSWEDYSMKEQLKLLARTRLMISLPGAALMNGAFLGDDSAIITFCRGLGTWKTRKGVEYRYWFNNLDYGTFLQFCARDEMELVGLDTYVKIPKLKENIKKLGL